MTVRPGVNILSRATPPPRGIPSDTGMGFAVGISAKGPTDQAVLVRNMTEFEAVFGARVSYGVLWDALDTFFHTGGTQAYVSRVVGPAAAKDTVTLVDGASASSIAVDSIGEYDSALTVQVVAGSVGGTFVLVIADGGVEKERSYDLVDTAAAASWGTGSGYVRVRALGSVDPAVVGATALASGTDDRSNITDTQRISAINRFPSGLALPGQVFYAGATTTILHEALLEHSRNNNRVALLDLVDTATSGTLIAEADALRASGTLDDTAEQWGGAFAPWITVPGITTGTSRTVAPSAIIAGLIAAHDAATGNPNDPAAGPNGEITYATALSQIPWDDATRQTMNTKGINVVRAVNGAIRLYGYRTLADPVLDPSWLAFSAARTRMAITADADVIGEEFMFAQIDGRGLKIAEFNGALTGMLKGYFDRGALYGSKPSEAFLVDTGASVNTPTTLADNQLRAVLSIRTSPYAEMVTFELVKVAITTALV